MFSLCALSGSVLILTLASSIPLVWAEDTDPTPQIDPYIARFGVSAMPSNTDRPVDDVALNQHSPS